ncbi:uncharacterized protein FA14DRAFT_161431 [Meira miltonrushii]|uniref:Myb-like domain-containing protein n=1 Tax=Meira miltonrushii TaxID=1280837 RepID=A0A316VBS9_9BASI|nr:uncharacterized protein FA14DRAFT_161431 [Meira miltonrushii]PWN33713.1 hypothetical protein FA14DRAFT_161431 [Meira miltonrushii]
MDSIAGEEKNEQDGEASTSQSVITNQNDIWPDKLIQSMLVDTAGDKSGQGYDIIKKFMGNTSYDADATSDDDDEESEDTEGEIQHLLEMRKAVSDLLINNEKYSDALKLAFSQVRLAIEEAKNLKQYLDHADSLSEHLSRGASIPVHSEKIKLPLFPDIYQEIPRIAYQAKEVEDLRISLSSFEWSEKDVKRLKEVVLKQCKKIAAIQMTEDGNEEDIFETIRQTSDEDLLQHAIPSLGEDIVDWTLIARELGETHTPESCRTRWLMKERPGLNKKDWTQDELVKLQTSVQKHKSTGQGSDWEAISRDAGNGRLAIDCLSAWQKNDFVDQDGDAASLTSQEKEQIESLFEVWGARSALIREHLPTIRKRSAIDTYIAQLQSERQKAPDMWLIESDVELVRHLARSVKSTRQVILRDPWRVKEVDWDAHFPMKPRGVSSDEVRHRWERIVRDSKVHPQKYYDLPKRTAEDEVLSSPKKRRGRPPKKISAN